MPGLGPGPGPVCCCEGTPVRAGREGPMRDLAAMPGDGATVKTHAKTLCGRPGKPPGETMEDCRQITPGISASH
jgi:hypothetical protein